MSLLEPSRVYKPFKYPWAYDAWLTQQRIHWLPEEVPLADDVRDWHHKLTDGERNLLTQIFRFFVQSDVEVANCYMRHYSRVFQATEVQMMLAAFSNMETVHIAAYSHLLDTVGMPEVEYQAFLKYEEMRAKADFLESFNPQNPAELAETLAVFGGFVEGMQLFASFAILMNFPRFNKMKGMGQLITWSVRDETLHCNSIIKLFHTLLRENPEIDKKALELRILAHVGLAIELEDHFIDLAFEAGDVEGLTAADVKQYIRFIADRRLRQLGYEPKFLVSNPLPWMDEMLNSPEFANFFESRVTEYSKAATTGEWDEIFGEFKPLKLITKPFCPYCEKAKAMLDDYGVFFETEEVYYKEMEAEAKQKWGQQTFPIIIDGDGKLIGGYSELRDWLRTA